MDNQAIEAKRSQHTGSAASFRRLHARPLGWGEWPIPSLILTLLLLATPSAVHGQEEASDNTTEPTVEQIEYFEKHIRPVLLQHCDDCHSAEADLLQGGLRLDSRRAMLTGGDSGPAIVPGNPDESLLLQSLRYESFEMPPDGQLPDQVIRHFETWIKMGAPDPRVHDATAPGQSAIDLATGRNHWSYQPVKQHLPPAVDDPQWGEHPVDRFIYASLMRHGLKPGPLADRATLLRRLTFDLTGLPPTTEEIQQFLDDASPDAYQRQVDRLLASPHFGEHWGRHWLDVVRYAESITLRGFVLPEAWRYRDYVIQAFHQDLPYDQFLVQQLAGDLLSAESTLQQQQNLIATTFLTLGNTNLEQQNKQQLEMDFVDEQLEVIGKALMAQTIGCARCHDHKFDPIPTRDYYALAGILANVDALEHDNVSKWIERPLPLDPERDAELISYQKRRPEVAKTVTRLQKQLTELEVQVLAFEAQTLDHLQATLKGPWQASTHTRPYLGDGYAHDGNLNKGKVSAVFDLPIPEDGLYEVLYSYTPGSNRATNAKIEVTCATGTQTIPLNMRKPPSVLGQYVSLGQFPFSPSTAAKVSIANTGTDGHIIVDGLMIKPIGEFEANPELTKLIRLRNQVTSGLEQSKQELQQIDRQLEKLPRVMTVREADAIRDLPVHIRGDVHRLGQVVPRGVLQVIDTGPALQFPAHQSGRWELAQWLTAPQHPLTHRVYVNRLWHWIFGQGLVQTVDNFGTTGARPTHPELLDYLSQRFVEGNGSTKTLIRELVLTRTYQLASTPTTSAQEKDPENRWLSHMRRKRISAESLRDTMLMASAELDLSIGGPTFPAGLSNDYDYRYDGLRRGVYVPVFRNSLPELYQVFDFPNPSLVVGRRSNSTSAPQALWMLNHPFVLTRADKTADRVVASKQSLAHQIHWTYLTCFGRLPTQAERELAETFLREEQTTATEQQAWSRLIQVLFASPEFRYIQ